MSPDPREPRDPRLPGQERDVRDPRKPGDPRDARDERREDDPRDLLDARPHPEPLPAPGPMWRWYLPATIAVLATIGLVGWGVAQLADVGATNRRLSMEICVVQQESRTALIGLARAEANELIDQSVRIARAEGRTSDAKKAESLREQYVQGQVTAARRALPEVECPSQLTKESP